MKISGWVLTAALAVPLTLMGQKVTGPNVIGGDKPTQGALEFQHFLTVLANEDQSEINLAHLVWQRTDSRCPDRSATRAARHPEFGQAARSSMGIACLSADG